MDLSRKILSHPRNLHNITPRFGDRHIPDLHITHLNSLIARLTCIDNVYIKYGMEFNLYR
jgi:hypothetical protein